MALADLFRKGIGPHWQAQIANLTEKVRWMVEQATQLVGLSRFGQNMMLLFEADMLFGNEDRHLNNIAVLRQGEDLDYCSLFDFGTGLLSNIRNYPLDIEPRAHLRLLRAFPLNTPLVARFRLSAKSAVPNRSVPLPLKIFLPLWIFQ